LRGLRTSDYIAAVLSAVLGSLFIAGTPAQGADALSGECCADLEARVADLEATTVARDKKKKLRVTISGWVFKQGAWWHDGHESNLYWGDAESTLSSNVQIKGEAHITSEWSAGYVLRLEFPGNSAAAGIVENQFNDNAWLLSPATADTLYSYLWINSDRWGTLNWGRLSQATNDVGLLPDLSGTILKSNAVMYNGAGMFVRPRGARNATDLATDFTWLTVLTCLAGEGIGADCNGYPLNAVRYDTPTFAGFSLLASYGEDDMRDIAVKYLADWGAFKVSAAYGFANVTDEGCVAAAPCTNIPFFGGGGAPFQGYRMDVDVHQVGVSVMHVPSGLWGYGYYEQEENNGTKFVGPAADANEPNTWFVKAGIRRTWLPLGATVIWGEGGQYFDQFTGLCGRPNANPSCIVSINTAPFDANGNPTQELVNIDNSRVDRWGVGISQEIDGGGARGTHLFLRWQHLELDLDSTLVGTTEKAEANFHNLDMYIAGAVFFF
jgi:predicted porin